MCVFAYKYKESTHFDFCLVKRVQRITVLRYTSVTPLMPVAYTNFLSIASCRVVINGEFSEWVHVKSGVPQGTVLGPLLFLLYINDLPDNISSSVKLFADNFVMYNTIKGQSDSSQLQSDLDTLWQIRFNATKCFVLRLSRARSPKQFKYTLGGTTLAETTSHSYLGIEITGDLKWGNHIHSITAKANRALGFIRRNLYSCPKELKATAYQTLVRPHLEFSCTVWDPYTQELKDQLEKVQDQPVSSAMTTVVPAAVWQQCLIPFSGTLWKPDDRWHDSPCSTRSITVRPPSRQESFYNRLHANLDIIIARPTNLNEQPKTATLTHSSHTQTIIDWNALPSNIINILDNSDFKEAVTNHLRSKSTSN